MKYVISYLYFSLESQPGMRCTRIGDYYGEPNNNFLCVPKSSPYHFVYANNTIRTDFLVKKDQVKQTLKCLPVPGKRERGYLCAEKYP